MEVEPFSTKNHPNKNSSNVDHIVSLALLNLGYYMPTRVNNTITLKRVDLEFLTFGTGHTINEQNVKINKLCSVGKFLSLTLKVYQLVR